MSEFEKSYFILLDGFRKLEQKCAILEYKNKVCICFITIYAVLSIINWWVL